MEMDGYNLEHFWNTLNSIKNTKIHGLAKSIHGTVNIFKGI